MKTLVNKANPQIRITAPEVKVYDKYYYIRNARLEILREYWTLVEEEDWREKRKKECPFRKADGCERYADVISECTGACSWVVDYPKLKEYQDRKKQEQPEIDLEEALNALDNAYFDLDGIAVKGATYYLTVNDLKDIARDFYELGQCKSKFTIAATEEELKKAMKERYPMPENADALTRGRIAAARNGFLSGYSWELGKKGGNK